jgi:signal transduction histidine kinase
VIDDGAGFDPAERAEPGHLGLSTIRERAELAGGWCRISSDVGAGSILECWMPLEPKDPA